MDLIQILLAAFLIGYCVVHFVQEATLATIVAVLAGVTGVILLVQAV